MWVSVLRNCAFLEWSRALLPISASGVHRLLISILSPPPSGGWHMCLSTCLSPNFHAVCIVIVMLAVAPHSDYLMFLVFLLRRGHLTSCDCAVKLQSNMLRMLLFRFQLCQVLAHVCSVAYIVQKVRTRATSRDAAKRLSSDVYWLLADDTINGTAHSQDIHFTK